MIASQIVTSFVKMHLLKLFNRNESSVRNKNSSFEQKKRMDKRVSPEEEICFARKVVMSLRKSSFCVRERHWNMFPFQITSAAETIHKTVTDIKVKHKEDLVVPFGVPWFHQLEPLPLHVCIFVLFESSELYVLFALNLFWNQLQWYSLHYGRKSVSKIKKRKRV